jgi:hypothetical protein
VQAHKLEFVLRAETPIAHHSGTEGNVSILMRQKVRRPGGGWSNVPYITGDTLRHQLRELGSLALLEAAGIEAGTRNPHRST